MSAPGDVTQDPGLPLWRCQLKARPDGPELSQWTVGDIYRLDCEGTTTTIFRGLPSLSFPKPEDLYTLHILSLDKASPNSAQFSVTGYKAGKYQPPFFEISDGQTKVRVEGLSWQVNSVLEAQTEGSPPPQPFPEIGPLSVPWPVWLWVTLISGILLLVLLGSWRWRRRMLRQRFLDWLAKHQTALSPYNQLNKDLRQLLRRYQLTWKEADAQREYIRLLDEAVRWYLSRELIVPVLGVSDRAILRQMRRAHKQVFLEAQAPLKVLLAELARAKDATGRLSPRDCEQLYEMTRAAVDVIYRVKSGAAR